MRMTVMHVTDASFEELVLGSELPVLVDLYADWCQPCKLIAPLVEKLASEYAGTLTVAKVNVDENPGLAQALRAQSIPMLVVIDGGRVVAEQVGALDEAALRKFVEPFLPAAADKLEAKELSTLLSAGRAQAVDVRDAGSFGRAHLPGAIHLSASEIGARASELSGVEDGRLRVLYGRTEDEARDAAAASQELGVPVAYLAGGMLGWESEGLPIERG
ncbi:MAG: thioredoxin [Deltaproteobacteria bacterium]|nr:thioredoxin [Deltaproteobacteria bacterium]